MNSLAPCWGEASEFIALRFLLSQESLCLLFAELTFRDTSDA
jgi:hypothetical protein